MASAPTSATTIKQQEVGSIPVAAEENNQPAAAPQPARSGGTTVGLIAVGAAFPWAC